MIYDCFPFNNELDILEIRLHELERVVDRFVLVEATRTQNNQIKPLYFKDNQQRFARWKDRIIHIVADDLPGGTNPWINENYQRKCIARGLTQCTDADTIVVSDLDEIPNAHALKPVQTMTILQHRLSYYFLNFATREPWHGTRILPFSLLRTLPSVQSVREANVGNVITGAGWHFSWTGGIDNIRQKIRSMAHQEFNKDQYLDPAHLRQAINAGNDLFDRDQNFELVDLTTLPAWVIENRQRFAHLLWSDFGPAPVSEEDCRTVLSLYTRVHPLIGSVVEINSGSGQTAAPLANASFPHTLESIDSAADDAKRAGFEKNMRSLTLRNVQFHAMSPAQFIESHPNPIKFCHIAGEHSAETLHESITPILSRLLPMGVLCAKGDVAGTPLQELLPGAQKVGAYWFWQRPWAQTDAAQPAHALNPIHFPQSQPYFDWPRQDVLRCIETQGIKATRAIELGCSSGLFGEKLKSVLGLEHYTGIEINPAAAATARLRLDEVHVVDLEKSSPADLGIPSGQADLLIALDILEHLHNPWDILANWVQILKPNAYFVTSIPNIQNITVILSLLQGHWNYDSAGLLDVTHLRFFTIESISQLLNGAGMKILRTDSVIQPPLDQSSLRDTGNTLQLGNVSLTSLSRQNILQLFTYQYILIAQRLAVSP